MPRLSPSSPRARRALLAAASVGLVLAGAGLAFMFAGDEPGPDQELAEEPSPDAEPTATPAPSPTPTPSPTATPTPASGPPWPMTGLPAESEEDLDRPILAAKIDNHPKARPQTGLDAADTVIVEVVEGTVRMIALYHSQRPDVVGPVRSGRLVDAHILPGFEPAFAFSGAARQVLPTLQEAGMPMVTEGHDGYFRERARRAPHNLYLELDALERAADGLPPGDAPWEHVADPPEGGTAVAAASLRYASAGRYKWEWDHGEQRWARSQDGAPHVTPDDEQLAAANVAVLDVDWVGEERRPFEPLGEGEATFLRDGEMHEGAWRKESSDAPYELLDADGEPFALAPGRLWIELLPSNGTFSVDEG